jgi:hypothetical protein
LKDRRSVLLTLRLAVETLKLEVAVSDPFRISSWDLDRAILQFLLLHGTKGILLITANK